MTMRTVNRPVTLRAPVAWRHRPPPRRGTPLRPPRRRPLSLYRATMGGSALMIFLVMVAVMMPVPILDGYLAGMVTQEIARQVNGPGNPAPPAEIAVRGGPLVPQILAGRLSEVEVALPDTTIGGVPHADVDAVMHGLGQAAGGAAHADLMTATVTTRFADLPPPPADQPRRTYGRAPNGALTVTVPATPDQAAAVRATVFFTLQPRGSTVVAIPQRLRLFGKTLPADKGVSLPGGGARTQQLPPLPRGLSYRSVTPEKDGLHVALAGVVTTPLSALPTTVGGRTVSYLGENGLLGLRTTVRVPPVVDVPLTIFTAPRLSGGTLMLVPRSVRVLGADRPPTDPIARVVLSQVKPQELTRRLPALPRGVAYRSVRVDGTGVTVAVNGATVRPFSELANGTARGVVFGAEDGLLTATSTGALGTGAPAPIVLVARPTIKGSTLDIVPLAFDIFGVLFPAASVLAELKVPETRYALEPLPANLRYLGVEVLPDALRIHLAGRDVTLPKGFLSPRPAAGPAAGGRRSSS
ncbi:MAG TPA: LmeA family phospholipid-binding protein [Kineosporiaceae bacterium]